MRRKVRIVAGCPDYWVARSFLLQDVPLRNIRRLARWFGVELSRSRQALAERIVARAAGRTA